MTTSFRPFALEELLSRHEQGVDFHFAESGVDPLDLATLDFAGPESRAGIERVALVLLRSQRHAPFAELIAACYPALAGECWSVGRRGGGEFHPRPNPDRRRGCDRLGAAELFADLGFGPQQRGRGAPHRPGRGARLGGRPGQSGAGGDRRGQNGGGGQSQQSDRRDPSDGDRAALVAAAESAGAWLLADEVYAGAERADGAPDADLWGSTRR